MLGALLRDGQAGVVAGEQLAEDIVPCTPGLRHMHQRRTDGMGDDDHLQQVRLLDQRQAVVLCPFDDGLGDALDERPPGEDHQTGNPHGNTVLNDAQQVGLISRVIDASDKHQFAAHDPLGDTLVLRHVWPAHGALQVQVTGTHNQSFQARQLEDFSDRQTHSSPGVVLTAARRPLN